MRWFALLVMCACTISDQRFAPTGDATGDGPSGQGFVIDKEMLTITEGQTGTFTVSLRHAPDHVVSARIISTSTAIDLTPTTIDFTPTNFDEPVEVAVAPRVDSNDIAETSTLSVESTGIPAGTLEVMTVDPTVIGTAGWPPPAFTATQEIAAGSLVAYQVTISANTNLDKFGVYIPAATGFFRMALYRDQANMPSVLVAQIGAGVALTNGDNTFDLVPDVPIDTSTTQRYWIAIRTSPANSIAYSDTTMGNLCVRQQDISNIGDPWPATFGAANCLTDYLLNLWIKTYR